MTPTETSKLVDLDRIRTWRAVCKTAHGSHCNDRYTEMLSNHLAQLTLVDVRRQCLVTLHSSTPYVALSYVWGNGPAFRTLLSNVSDLHQPGSLSRGNPEAVIPNTIRDAIQLVEELGEQYLWVDRLCIIQDAGAAEIENMLKAMACIYASAEFTIAAADGSDADYGLPGILGSSQERSDDRIPGVYGQYPSHSRWASRGWTFQESLFSRRLLVFAGIVTWFCGRRVWDERDRDPLSEQTELETAWPAERQQLGVPVGMMSILPQLPCLGRWGALVENYSSRSLTIETDFDRAFAGATQIMNGTFSRGLFYGLPEFFFDIALLWQPEAWYLSLLRRQNIGPSWSWTGWKGQVDCCAAWDPFFAGVFKRNYGAADWSPATILKPIVQFYKMGESGANLVPICNDFVKFRELRNDADAVLPQGWRRHPDTLADFFLYENEDPQLQYNFPLPVANPSEHNVNGNYSYFLQFKAPKATLRFGGEISTPKTFVAVLVGVDGCPVGSITLHSFSDHAAIEGSSCELIAISEAEVSDLPRFEEEFWSNDPCTWDIIKWETGYGYRQGTDILAFYNVLWIGWDGDTAYRKGLGKVGKRAWDALGAKEVTITLG
ncbi:HET-domain-containing protein [Amniculicola lignicola CBS 123094]|uniref:HET-domain-containing protein n=1 Tax=Amniculicola lignicola CBS 123094 TaxID=1392246 RepID=A0A6A5WQ21_9PLEO|nr:HET-domain-containing protein [Amniculicola lignicola CBS 123094]